MCERLLRQSVCLHSQSPPQKLCMGDESLDSLVLVRTGAAIAEGASQPRRPGGEDWSRLLADGYEGSVTEREHTRKLQSWPGSLDLF